MSWIELSCMNSRIYLLATLRSFPKNAETLIRINIVLKNRATTPQLDEQIDVLSTLLSVRDIVVVHLRWNGFFIVWLIYIYCKNTQIYPSHCPFRHDLALAFLKKELLNNAENSEQEALHCTRWTNSHYVLTLAQIYIKQNRLWKAESLLRRAQILFKDGSGLHLLGTFISATITHPHPPPTQLTTRFEWKCLLGPNTHCTVATIIVEQQDRLNVSIWKEYICLSLTERERESDISIDCYYICFAFEKEAIKIWRKALRLESESRAEIYFALGTCYFV
jgi:tetratricopeptide (TPR) repeat protein